MSADTSASVRPTSGMSPACSCAATRSAAAPARRRASISASSLMARSGAVTSLALPNDAVGSADCRSTRNRAQVRSPIASRTAGPQCAATRAIGSSVSSHGSIVKTSGCSTTRGASRRGTTSVASPSAGTTSIVSRSSGIAS